MGSAHDALAGDYDRQVKEYGCFLAEALFGLSYEYIREGESILDVGIGTGVSSGLFHKAGLRVYGIDGSAEMLRLCDAKRIAVELSQHDVSVLPWPYRDGVFHHATSCGVFHFIGELGGVFTEISRIQKPGGIFAFTVMAGEEDPAQPDGYDSYMESGIRIFRHRARYIAQLLEDRAYRKEKEMLCFVGSIPFRAIVARKQA